MAAPTAEELAGLIEQLLPQAWKDCHNDEPLPTPVNEDGQALFLAIGRAVVKFLSDHKADFVTSITLAIPALTVAAAPGTTAPTTALCTVSKLDFNL